MQNTYRFKFDKLIRSKIPQLMELSDIKVFLRDLSNNEYQKKLKDKLFEEYSELINAQSQNEICEELADLLEILIKIAESHDIDFATIQKTASDKRESKGSFNKNTYCAFIEMQESNSKIHYYRANSDKYLEIK
jgi:predicted house-cleaning noncanonical NTP pyrophosphatase (MazG superfamily)